MNEEKITIAYVRLSEEDILKSDKYSESIYNQLSLIKDYAKRMGLNIDKEYIDDGYSGINFDRPGFEKLKDDIDSGKIATVITKDMSRLGREFIETAYYISEYFPKKDIRYIAINDKYDSNDPDSSTKDIMVGIRSIVNDNYVKESSIKRKQVAFSKTENGEFIGFIAPYGYKIIKEDKKRTLEIDDYAANIVKRIFTNIASGKSREEVANELNKEKILPPIIYLKMTPNKNKKYYNDWSDKIIYRILKNETYTGKIVVRKSKTTNYRQKKRTVVAIRDRETKPNTHPAIISDSLFREANSKLKTLKRREKNNYDGTFSGLVVCGECGRIMSACRKQRNNESVKYYFICTKIENRKKCQNRIIHDSKLKSIVQDTLRSLFDTYIDKDFITDTITKELMLKDRFNLKISNIEKDIEKHNKNIRDLYIKKTKDEISIEEFLKVKKEETSIKEQKEKDLKSIIEKNNADVKKVEVVNLYNQFINEDIMLKDYIKDIIEKIIIYKDNTIQIVFKFGVSETKTIKLY